MISQKTTYHKDFSIKSYIEMQDGLVTVVKHYNKQGNVIYLKYCGDNWQQWRYNKDGYQTLYRNYKGEYLLRRFNKEGRMTYEETHQGCNYDISKRLGKNN